MTSALRATNEELLRQLIAGQNAVKASFNQLEGIQCSAASGVLKDSKHLQERKNIEIKTGIRNARLKLAAKTESEPSHFKVAREFSEENGAVQTRSPNGFKNRHQPRDEGKTVKFIDNDCPKLGEDEGSFNRSSTSLLMEDLGNLRRPKRSADEVDLDDSQGVRSILHRSGVHRRTTPTRVHFEVGGADSTTTGASSTSDKNGATDSSLLGYDWIAGMLENSGKMEALDNSADFFEDLRQFRQQNKEECVAREFRHEALIEDVIHDLRPGQRLDVQPRNGQLTIDQIIDARDNDEPVYAYTVNERLFPTPINAETENREPGTPEAPQILKISIPSYRLQPRRSRLQPHRRRSVDESDSFSLISHCQVGFKPGALCSMKSAAPADLPSSVVGENTWKRQPPKSEKEAISAIRRSIPSPRKAPADLKPNPAPRVVDAMLTRREMNLDPSVTARCEAVRRAGAMRFVR